MGTQSPLIYELTAHVRVKMPENVVSAACRNMGLSGYAAHLRLPAAIDVRFSCRLVLAGLGLQVVEEDWNLFFSDALS